MRTMKTIKYTKLKKFIEIQGIITGVAVFLFFVLSLVSLRISAGDFSSSRHHAASPASLFSQRIYGIPEEPIVVLSSSCENDVSRVTIDWGEDEDATSYDIYRNGSVLVTGLTGTIYFDDNVDDSTTYLYYVTANGPAGSETSDIESVTTFACGGILPIESISVVTFDGQNVQNPSSEYDTTNRRPQITGTTTIENALIDIQLHGGSTSFAVTNANVTGYWHWTPVSNLSYGDYTMYLTATDPLDNSNTASRVFTFEIEREDEEDEDDEEDEEETIETTVPVDTQQPAPQPTEPTEPKPEVEKAIDFSIVVINEYGKVSSGEYLDIRLIILDVAKKYENEKGNLNISIVDSQGQELDRDSFDLRLYGGQRLEKRMLISCPQKEGRYIIRAEIVVDEQRVSEEAVVDVLRGKDCAKFATGLETSLIGGEMGLNAICSFTDWLGWLVIILLLLLLILIFIFMILTRRKKQEESEVAAEKEQQEKQQKEEKEQFEQTEE